MSSGQIVQIIGAVIDVEFPRDSVPKVYDALLLEGGETTLEVQQQLGDGIVRTIAMGSTEGLKRGLKAENTGNPISVPVGTQTLGRIMDVLGRPIDEAGEIGEEDSQYDNYDDCHSDAESFMRDLWPADECDQGRIAGDTFLDCDDRARLIACDGSIAEVYTAWDECNASEVCTDPAE